MKKVAILTLYNNSSNYGGLLQAYALQKVLNNLGFDAKQIDYNAESGRMYKNKKEKYSERIKSHLRKIKYLEWTLLDYRRKKQTDIFAREIPHTRLVKKKNIHKLSDNFDFFVCGSDQIWNPIGWQPSFFLDFVSDDKRKISYAASIARDSLTNQELNFMYNYLKKFNSVSIREKKSKDIMEKFCSDITIDVMPDPTLLLTENEWKILIKDKKSDKKDYIFAYLLGKDIQQRERIVDFAKARNLELVFVPYLNRDMIDWDKKHMQYMAKNYEVSSFLSYIKDANMVITDSFHGAVFSIIFDKNFFVLNRFKKHDKISMNSRLETLLDTFNLDERLIDGENLQYTLNTELSPENLESIKITKTQLRSLGINFLEKSLIDQ
ncbi:polysaccharide pyruvyl transferase family protein [Enterococcus sp. LJL90]